MLRHLSNRRSFWLCSHCRLEIPDSDRVVNGYQEKTTSFNSSILKTTITSSASSHKVAAI